MNKYGLLLTLIAALSLSLASVALAQGGQRDRFFKAELRQLNHSKANGDAFMKLEGRKLTTRIASSDLSPNLVHVQHIHGMAQAISECPSLAADQNGDGLVSTAEGVPSYGPVAQSLTTRGDHSPNSGLAVARFPVANRIGSVVYERTFKIPANVAKHLGRFAIVEHGVDLNHNGRYDFKSAGKSELDPSLPQEATLPAVCGVINPF